MITFDLLGPPLVDPPSANLDQAWDLLSDGMRHMGAHPERSRRYAQMASGAGLEVVSQRGFFLPVPPAAAIGETTNFLCAASASLIASGLVTQEEIDRILQGLAADQRSWCSQRPRSRSRWSPASRAKCAVAMTCRDAGRGGGI